MKEPRCTGKLERQKAAYDSQWDSKTSIASRQIETVMVT
ncbi:hypothetical protein T4B_2521 [Trichinella pseudospiralis]|uniref:Uncharacterized protein n=1 Tax=Trichinella pseudospiralis TaxID=6337 RepID=A0A0V1GMU9_TRIPS|nr:hypothetical protein T4B_2521 [Trichinella pseudospiralis]